MTRLPRTGTTLVELLVALPVALLVATAATLLLLRIARTVHAQSARLASSRELRQVSVMLAGELAPLRGEDLLVVSDTLLAFQSPLGVLLLCDRSAPHAVVVAVPDQSADAWLAGVRPGDRVRGWQTTTTPVDTPVATERAVTAPPSVVGGTGCGTDRSTTSRRWRVPLDSGAVPFSPSGPLTVHRDVRYRHYRSGSAWWWGRQSRDGAVWDAIQPVAGPLQAAALGGVRIRLLDATGAPVGPLPAPASNRRGRIAMAQVTFSRRRRASRTPQPVIDTVTAVMPLRATAYRQRP
ncbi:hypothetical protein [Gemmatimonas sp.]|uniref:hypothetical protein n=1 Tax=Gemmatimonas sp. TaxID=1962908 RepID=UPI0022BDBA4F|nr:hypothetical protein [Gemmatimonas sp.]MCZ8012336.1 hypothetical protein [Gemmatimonas sp.]MCZ8266734.1 hypothetical protein [Gemmatimonas sp.]